MREHLTATACIAVLVLVAFYAAYAGGGSQQIRWVAAEQQPQYSSDAEQKRASNQGGAQDTPATGNHVVPSSTEGKCTDDCENVDNKGSEFWPTIFNHRLKITDTLVALFTGLLFFATIGLWLSTRKLWKIGIHTHEASERAFVFIAGFDSELTTAAHGVHPEEVKFRVREGENLPLTVTRFAAQPKWKNSGNSPTKNMKISTHWALATGTIPDFNDYPKDAESFFIGPNAVEPSELVDMVGAPQALINWEMKPIGARPLVLLWGRASYDDIFGHGHFVEWCYRVRLENHKGDGLRAHFIQWGSYNRTDETAQ